MMMDNEIAVKVENIEKSFGLLKVLNGINLEIRKGETFVIMGGSGSGKSTLLRIMSGAVPPTRGKVFLGGKEVSGMDEGQRESVKRRLGMCFQSAALLDSLTVEQNVSLPLEEHTRLSPRIISLITKMKLNLVGLQGFEQYFPSMLSGGMRKRAGLARAIALDPEIVFYDEPTAGLDPVMCAVIDRLILDLTKKLNLTSIVVTHNMESVFRIADRVAMIYQGALLEVGTQEQIRHCQNPIIQQFIKGEIEGPIHIT